MSMITNIYIYIFISKYDVKKIRRIKEHLNITIVLNGMHPCSQSPLTYCKVEVYCIFSASYQSLRYIVYFQQSNQLPSYLYLKAP